MGWLKAYQQAWCDKLKDASTKEEVLEVVDDMLSDDTGGTDLVAMYLASAVSEQFGENNE
jgi:hypothetical protein